MNQALAITGLFVLATVLFLLPLVPAIAELRWKRDAQALNVIQQYAGDIRHFSFGFRSYASDLLEPLRECVAAGGTATGTLRHGDRYLLLGRPDSNLLFSPASDSKTCDVVVISGTDLTAPDGTIFARELYATRSFSGGEGCTYRAILGDADIRLKRASHVARWAHAAESFHAGEDCDLYGRISSDREIELETGCVFQRLNAPRIAFGASAEPDSPAPYPIGASMAQPLAPGVAGSRRLVDRDLEIPPGEVVTASLVTRGNLRIGAGARILGSVKSNKRLEIDSNVFVAGSAISVETIRVGSNCQIGGPVIAEKGMVIGAGSRCGTAESPTTVSTLTAEIEEGVVVFGTIWARHEGQVVPAK